MVEGLYRGWDELRSVPTGTQSGLRIIVLFTDGASQRRARRAGTRPGHRESAPHVGLPEAPPDPDGQTLGRSRTSTACTTPQTGSNTGFASASDRVELEQLHTGQRGTSSRRCRACRLTMMSWHTHHRSSGIPTSFPLVDECADGERRRAERDAADAAPRAVQRGPLSGRGLQHQQRRAQSRGDHRQPGAQRRRRRLPDPHLHDRHGRTGDATSSAPCPRAVDGHPQADGERPVVAGLQPRRSSKASIFYAQTAADVSAAFQGIQNQILRLSK